jgi:hypothetical protein
MTIEDKLIMPKKKTISGTDFEFYIYKTVRKNFPLREGWEILENVEFKVGRSLIRPDFVVRKRNVYAVIDAKDKAILEPRDVDQILFYAEKTKAKEAIIYVANDTEVPQTVKDYADSEGVKIRTSLWRIS